MVNIKDCPILDCELTLGKKELLSPFDYTEYKFNTDKLIITFFKGVIDKLLEENKIHLLFTIPGENSVDCYEFYNTKEIIILGYVGCPACGGDLEVLHAMGINKVMFCGGGGVLDKNIEVGQILVTTGAIRDEGFSYHYIEPSRVIYTKEKTVNIICNYLDKEKVPYIKGLCWTTDAIYRETKERIKQRKEEGAKIVEMEQAGNLAVSQFRGFDYGSLIYGGDDVSGDVWDERRWKSRTNIRYNLVMLCRELVNLI